LQNIIQDAVQGMGDLGRNARVSTRASNDGSSWDVHIHLGQNNTAPQESESQMRMNQARRMLRIARQNLNRLENPNANRQDNAEEDEMETDNERAAPQQQRGQDSQSQASSQTDGRSEPQAGSQPNGANANSTRTPSGLIRPRISALGEMLNELHDVNRRFQPFLERFQQLLIDDPELSETELQSNQQMCNLVSETMHAISHAYHSISDLMIDLSQDRPRFLFAAFMSPPISHTAVIQQTIPVHVNATPTTSVQSTGTSTVPPVSLPEGAEGGPDEIVMVQMAPHAITRISAEVVTSESERESSTTTTNTGNASQGQGPAQGHSEISPDLIQQIVSSVVQAHASSGNPRGIQVQIGPHGTRVRSTVTNRPNSTAAPGGVAGNPPPPGGRSYAQAVGVQTSTSQTSSGSTQTSTGETSSSETQTSATTTNTSGTQTRPRASAFVMPGATPGMPPIPGLSRGGVDPYLPCSSRHFLRFHAAQNNPQEGEEGFNGLMNNLLSGLMQQPNPHLQGNARRAGAASTATSSATTATATATSASTTRTSTAASTTTTQSSTQSGQGPFPRMPFPMPGMFGPGIPSMQGMPFPGIPGMPGMPRAGMPSGGMPSGNLPPQLQRMVGPIAQMFASMMDGGPPPTGFPPDPSQRPSGGAPTEPPAGGAPIPPPPGGAGPQPPPSGAGPGPAGQQGEPQFVQMLRGLLQSGAQNTASNSSSSSNTTGADSTTNSTDSGSSDRYDVMTDDVFTSLVQGISQVVTNTAMGQGSPETISTFLNNLGAGQQIIPGEGFVNEVFSVVSNHLTFSDLMQIFYGSPQPMDRLREPLQTFLTERVLNGGEANSDNIEAGVERLIADMQEELVATSNVSEVKEDIDIVASWNSFFRQNLRDVIMLIMRREQDSGFGQLLYSRMRLCLSHFIVLTERCLCQGTTGLNNLVQDRLRYITRGVNPMIQQWMISVTTQQLAQFQPTITATEQDIKTYVVKKDKRKAESAPKPVPMETTSPVMATQESPQAMDVDGKDETPSTSSAPAPPALRPKVPVTNGNKVRGRSSREPSSPSGADNSWTNEVPADWVPVINGDVEKQKNGTTHSPYSDAYLNGMPPKRRKLMTQDRPSSLTNSSQTIPESIKRAAAAARVEPISSLENLTNEAASNSELRDAYEAQVSDVIGQRLETDSDYRPERFPNSKEYFQKNHKK
ncbi:hypothetical protein FSP39_009769, partial [Pinctada imbricata]